MPRKNLICQIKRRSVILSEIKIRWWDEENKCFWYGEDDEKYGDITGEMFAVRFKAGKLMGLMLGEIDHVYNRYELTSRELPISLYTGLHDKNDRPIYSGSILKRTVHVVLYGSDLNEYVDEFLEVKYKEEYACFFCNDRLLYEFVGAKFDVSTGCSCTDVEVVGDIWRNAELLRRN